MPSYDPYFATPLSRRRLLSVYNSLHHSLHTKPTHPKILHSATRNHTTIAWSTPVFELYAIAPANTPRAGLAQAANRLIQYIKKEEERIFIIGGAVF
jgi:vacuolar fusion protein MON1